MHYAVYTDQFNLTSYWERICFKTTSTIKCRLPIPWLNGSHICFTHQIKSRILKQPGSDFNFDICYKHLIHIRLLKCRLPISYLNGSKGIHQVLFIVFSFFCISFLSGTKFGKVSENILKN